MEPPEHGAAKAGPRAAFAPWDDPGATPLVVYDRVTKRFGAETAVADLSLAVYEREFFALLGPSGCGKSTLMRMLAGFEAPSEGRVLLAGEDLAGVPPHLRPVNMMFQSYALFPHMSVEKNIAFGLAMEGRPRDEIGARVGEALRMVKLDGLAARKPHQLSGGQRQRVALARALVKRPKVLLLDEPLGALDRKLREETQFELMALQERLGLTFIIVTHDQDEAMTMATRIAVMDKGRLAQIGTPRTIYEAPATRYVADFIGDINCVEGTVSGVDGAGSRCRRRSATWSLRRPLRPFRSARRWPWPGVRRRRGCCRLGGGAAGRVDARRHGRRYRLSRRLVDLSRRYRRPEAEGGGGQCRPPRGGRHRLGRHGQARRGARGADPAGAVMGRTLRDPFRIPLPGRCGLPHLSPVGRGRRAQRGGRGGRLRPLDFAPSPGLRPTSPRRERWGGGPAGCWAARRGSAR